MAKQIGDIKITGTIEDITFYKMEGQYYARRKSSLKGTRVKKDPRFKRTMQSAQRLARGSQLASKVYRSLPIAEQVYSLYKELKSIAILALKEGKNELEVLVVLEQRLIVRSGGAVEKKTERSLLAERKKRGTERKNRFLQGGRLGNLFAVPNCPAAHRSRRFASCRREYGKRRILVPTAGPEG